MKSTILSALSVLFLAMPCQDADQTGEPTTEVVELIPAQDEEINVEPVAEEVITFEDAVVVTESLPENASNQVELTVETLEQMEWPTIPNRTSYAERYHLANLYTDDQLVAACIETEAGNQGLEGKRMVADCIYNRVDMAEFPNSVKEVILQKGAFGVVANGAIWRVRPSAETMMAMEMEKNPANRVNTDLAYFRTGRYSSYGYAFAHVGAHYFSTQHR